jgi:hypothetical protein
MSSAGISSVAAVASIVVLAFGLPSASAAPATDEQGYVDSTARCAAPAVAVLFGATEDSRVAICKLTDGQYEYRGVRLRDGAKLIVSAEHAGYGFFAESGDMSYLVTEKSLVISLENKVIREEPMVDFHGPDSDAPETSTTPLPPPLPAEVGGGADG